MILRVTLIASWVVLIFMNVANADIPALINYQGRLTATDGNPVGDASYLIRFSLWNDSIATNPVNQIWTSNYVEVPVSNGIFTFTLGSTMPLPMSAISSGMPLWLSVKVGTDPELLPRTRFTSVPFSVKALHSDSSQYATQALSVIRSRDLYHQIIDVNPNSITSVPILTDGFTQQVVLYLYGSSFQGALADHTHVGTNSHGHSFTGSISPTSIPHSHDYSGSTAEAGGEHSHTGTTSAVDLSHGHSISIGDHNLSHRHDGPSGGHNHEFTADGLPGTGNYLTIDGQTNILSASNTGDRTLLQAVKRAFLVYDLTSPIGHSASIGLSLGSHSHGFTTANTTISHGHSYSGTTASGDFAHGHALTGQVSTFGDGLESTGLLQTALPSNVNIYVDGVFAAGPFSGVFNSGPIDLASFITTPGVHMVEIREEGGTGGRLTYNLFVD